MVGGTKKTSEDDKISAVVKRKCSSCKNVPEVVCHQTLWDLNSLSLMQTQVYFQQHILSIASDSESLTLTRPTVKLLHICILCGL